MNNPSAFPSAGYGASGMTLRDYFAGQALAGMLGNPNSRGASVEYASAAYRYADVMLAERELTP